MTARVAVVTGGTGALGQAVTRRLVDAGVTVAIPYLVDAELKSLEAGLGTARRERLHAVQADVLDETAFGDFVKGVLDRHRRVDVLVNAVGGFAGGDLVATTLADWNRMLTLNLTSAVIGCRGVLPAMIAARSGRIINIASRAVVPPLGGFIAYTVAKAGVITLTQALAQEVKPYAIMVNAVLPSTMDTPANRRAMPDADRSGWVSLDAVAAVIGFLASDESGPMTGAAIPV
jgi:NAD(P)-dependent dehydrogenase (short-subunit alcohol dehydrogenase family)